MGSADEDVELDCSGVDVAEAIDDPVIGMLVTLARAARGQGAQVALVRPPRPMRVQLEAARVAHFFDWKP
jgi:anti-anti-sigma regulatory factor